MFVLLCMYLRTSETAPPYRPGLDRKSVYKSVWQRHWRDFREVYPERFAHRYGDLTPEKCHVTFTLPGTVTRALFDKRFFCEELITVAAGVYWKELLKSAGNPGKEWQSGSIAALHKCGNALNYNPHVHLIGTRELVDTTSGEILRSPFLNYRRMRFSWMNAALRIFRKNGIFTEEDIRDIKERYKNGFHVHL